MAAERGLAGRGVRWLTTESATDGWALETRGYAMTDGGRASQDRGRQGALAAAEGDPASGEHWQRPDGIRGGSHIYDI